MDMSNTALQSNRRGRDRDQHARQCRSTPLQTQIGQREQPRRADLNGIDEAVG